MNQQNNWFTYFFLFFIGSTVAGFLSTALVSLLGFSVGWTSILTVGMMGIAFFLLWQRYAVGMWLLVACLGFLGLVGIALARGFLIEKPQVPEAYAGYFDEASLQNPELSIGNYLDPFSSGYYPDYYENYFDGVVTIAADEERALIDSFFSDTLQLNIDFPVLESLNGEWAFESGTIRTSGAMNRTFRANPDENWFTVDDAEFVTDPTDDEQPVEPYLVISLPYNGNLVNKDLTIDATLTILIPTAESPTGESQTLERRFSVLIAGAEFYEFRNDYYAWERAKRVKEMPVAGLLLVGCAAAVGGSVFLVNQGAHRSKSTGFALVMRKKSGLQRLGVEAHSLDRLAGFDSQGVILGFVNAQSPAGRGGLRSGDIVLTFDNKEIRTPRDLERASSAHKKGDVVLARVRRNEEDVDIVVTFS